MRDLLRRGNLDAETAQAFAERRDSAEALGRAIREAIEKDRAVRLRPGDTANGQDGGSVG